MNDIQIIGAMMLATGKRVPDIAKDHGIAKSTLYRAARGDSQSQKLRDKIQNEIVGDVVTIIWPEGGNNGNE